MSSPVSRDEPPGGPSLSAGLADLDRRLRALQDELAAAEAPAPSPSPSGSAEPAPPPAASDPAAPERLAEELAVAIIARADAQAERIVEAAHERVRFLSRQAEELLELQESLRRSARELIDAYAEALARLEASDEQEPGPPIA